MDKVYMFVATGDADRAEVILRESIHSTPVKLTRGDGSVTLPATKEFGELAGQEVVLFSSRDNTFEGSLAGEDLQALLSAGLLAGAKADNDGKIAGLMAESGVADSQDKGHAGEHPRHHRPARRDFKPDSPDLNRRPRTPDGV